MAVMKAVEDKMSTIACSSTGNAASSLAGNAAAMGLKTFIFVPGRAPQGKVAQLLISGQCNQCPGFLQRCLSTVSRGH